MLPFDEVSVAIVTRGNTDLRPVLDYLQPFSDIVIWDNSVEDDHMTYGRVRALERCRNDIVFSTDDDIVHPWPNLQRIVAAYQPGVLTGCMWQEWSDGAKAQGIEHGYDDLVFMGSGSVFDRDVPRRAAERYLAHYPADDFFHLWADTIIGILAPTKQLDIRFQALPIAEAPDRMCNLPNAVEQKTEAIRRAREIRDRKASWHDVRIASAMERVLHA